MKFTKEKLQELEEKSVRNLIHFYREELLEVDKGNSIFFIIPHKVRKQFVKDGIITKGINFYKSGSVYKLTKKGKEMLGINVGH